MRKIAVNQILKHGRSVTNEEKKLNEFIQECSLYSIMIVEYKKQTLVQK